MNAMPHLVLGTWKGRMFSLFGFGNLQNVLYAILNLVISVGLFIYQYGIQQLFKNGIYAGALALLVIYFLTGWFWHTLFHQNFANIG